MRSILGKNKKGAEMTIGTIIIIVLALVVLVILVSGFTTGWTNLWEKITAFGGGKVNVQSVVQSCQLACTTGSRYDYCELSRDVTFDETGDANVDNRGGWRCAQLEFKGTGLECPAIKCGVASVNLGGNNPSGVCAEVGGEWNEVLKVCEEKTGNERTHVEICAALSNEDCKVDLSPGGVSCVLAGETSDTLKCIPI